MLLVMRKLAVWLPVFIFDVFCLYLDIFFILYNFYPIFILTSFLKCLDYDVVSLLFKSYFQFGDFSLDSMSKKKEPTFPLFLPANS